MLRLPTERHESKEDLMKLFKSKYDKLTREEVVDAICQLEKELQGIESQLSEQQKRVDDLMVKGQKEKNKDIKIVAVEPAESPLISKGIAGQHGIQGIGANFIPEILDRNIIDEVYTVTTDEAYQSSREVAQKEGLLVGISSGSVIDAAKHYAKNNKKVVIILPDSGERYLSTELYK